MNRYGLQWSSLQDYLAFEETSNSGVWGEGGSGVPPDNHIFLYAKDKSGTSALYFKNDAGTETEIPSGTIVTGTGVSGRVAFWNGTSSLSSDSDLTFATDTLTATKIIITTAATLSYITAGSILFAGTAGLLSQDNANLFWDDTNNRLGIGTAVPGFQIHAIAPDASSFNCTLEAYGTGVSANYRGRVARGTAGSPSQLLTDDNCTLLSALPYNSSPGFAGGARAQIQMNAAEAQTSSNQGMYISFKTTPTGGSTTIAERFRIGPAGQWGIGGATFGTANNIFKSGGASAAPSWGTVNILDSDSHGDTLTGTVVRGDLIVGNSTPKWSRLAKGAASTLLKSDGTDVSWLSYTGDWLSQYALLAGRSSGQTLIGGTAAADGLNLVATAGVGAGSETINFKLGNNGGKQLMSLQWIGASTSQPGVIFDSAAASTQFNMIFADNGTAKWYIYKTTGNDFIIYDAVNAQNTLTFKPAASLASSAAVMKLAPTISTSNATAIGFYSNPTFTGSGEGPWGSSLSAVFTPSASITACYNSLNIGVFGPPSSVTITSAFGAYYGCSYNNTSGAVTQAFTLWCNTPSIAGSLKPTTQYGLYVQNQGAAGITNGIGIHIEAMSGGTNSYDMSFGRVDTTAAGAYYGRVPVLYNGLLKYIHVFSA